jgi:hypothetical protein
MGLAWITGEAEAWRELSHWLPSIIAHTPVFHTYLMMICLDRTSVHSENVAVESGRRHVHETFADSIVPFFYTIQLMQMRSSSRTRHATEWIFGDLKVVARADIRVRRTSILRCTSAIRTKCHWPSWFDWPSHNRSRISSCHRATFCLLSCPAHRHVNMGVTVTESEFCDVLLHKIGTGALHEQWRPSDMLVIRGLRRAFFMPYI